MANAPSQPAGDGPFVEPLLVVQETDLGLEVTMADGSGRLLLGVGTGPGQFIPTKEQERTLASFRGPLGKALSVGLSQLRNHN
jgi:hypothetical protein